MKLLTAEQLSAIRIAVWDAGDAAFIQYAESLLEHIEALQDTQWVQITEDESTWPDGINLVLACVNLDDGTLSNPRIMRCGYGKHWIGYWYRPLNDNDYPPKED